MINYRVLLSGIALPLLMMGESGCDRGPDLPTLNELLDRNAMALGVEAQDSLDSIPYYRVRLTLSDGFERWYYVNTETFLIDRARDVRELHANDGNTRVLETVFSDYRERSGMLFPFTVYERDVWTGERLHGRTMLDIFPNAEVPDSLFDITSRSEFGRVQALRPLAEDRAR